jgi:hypothetical protein
VPSLGMHESQSRMWGAQVGRGRPFTDFLLPHLKERFPEEIGMVPPEEFYRGVNFVTPSLIRVNADELTYNLHIALRFRLEVGLFRDELTVDDLPKAWDNAMEEFLGIRPDSQATGVLQDMGRLGAISPAAVRDRLGISRKFLIPLLEWADDQGITIREGDGRRVRTQESAVRSQTSDT